MTEQQPYTLVHTFDQFEVRSYPAHMLAQVNIPGGLDGGAGAGFGPLFQYISGANQSQQSIAMTAPVLQQRTGEQEQTVSFVLPAGMSATSTPTPSDSRVSTRAVAARTVAAQRFAGSARPARFADRGQQLIAAVRAAGFETIGEVYYARFDPPWMPGFLRHNEALVELSAADS
jgi:hypothetical protein